MLCDCFRVGPRQIRTESCLIRPFNPSTGACPFESLQVGDVGDIAINTYNLPACVDLIRKGIAEIICGGCKTLTMGGDHTITYPILQAIRVSILYLLSTIKVTIKCYQLMIIIIIIIVIIVIK